MDRKHDGRPGLLDEYFSTFGRVVMPSLDDLMTETAQMQADLEEVFPQLSPETKDRVKIGREHLAALDAYLDERAASANPSLGHYEANSLKRTYLVVREWLCITGEAAQTEMNHAVNFHLRTILEVNEIDRKKAERKGR